MVLELVAFCAWQWIDKVSLIDPWLLGETDPNSGCNIPVVLVLRRPQLEKCKSSSPRGLKKNTLLQSSESDHLHGHNRYLVNKNLIYV